MRVSGLSKIQGKCSSLLLPHCCCLLVWPHCLTSLALPSISFSRSLFANDSAFLFNRREEMIRSMSLVVHCFANFGLEVHLGTGSVPSKTEAMFFPIQNSDPLVVTTETADFKVFPGRFISFCDKFTYLGSLLMPDKSDKAEITRQIGLAHGQMKFNKPILCNKKIELKICVNMFMAL
jgi:hypothetical protein